MGTERRCCPTRVQGAGERVARFFPEFHAKSSAWLLTSGWFGYRPVEKYVNRIRTSQHLSPEILFPDTTATYPLVSRYKKKSAPNPRRPRAYAQRYSTDVRVEAELLHFFARSASNETELFFVCRYGFVATGTKNTLRVFYTSLPTVTPV